MVINKKILLYSTGNYAQYPEGEEKKKRMVIVAAIVVGLNIAIETARLKIQQSGAIENNSL